MNDDSSIVPFPRESGEKPDAADWLAKLDRGDLTGDERHAFETWLAEDPRNKSAIRRIAGFWYGLDAPLGELCPPARIKTRRADGRGIRFRGSLAAVGAMCAIAVLAVTVMLIRGAPDPQDETDYFATEIGQTRFVLLSDGSTITLNTNSILEQAYTGEQRTVRLVSGEAVFDVAHDATRPFVVHAASGLIRAIGTRFAVRIGSDNVDVTVTEGRIAMQQRPVEGSDETAVGQDTGSRRILADPIIVRQGEAGRIHRTEGASKRAVTPQAVNERLSWVDGELVFYDREFQAVVEEIARYTPVVIRIDDERLRSRRITGIIQIGDMDMMLESIEQNLGVTVERVSPTLVRLRS